MKKDFKKIEMLKTNAKKIIFKQIEEHSLNLSKAEYKS